MEKERKKVKKRSGRTKYVEKKGEERGKEEEKKIRENERRKERNNHKEIWLYIIKDRFSFFFRESKEENCLQFIITCLASHINK